MIVGEGAVPLPVRLTTPGLPVVELLAILNCPVAAPATVGSNTTTNWVYWPGFSVAGRLAPDSVKPVPVKVAELIVNGPVPADLSVTDWLAGVLRAMFPKARLV